MPAKAPKTDKKLRKEIFAKISEYYRLFHAKKPFEAGKSHVNYGGRVYDDKELINLTDSALDFWLTSGRYCADFERALGAFLGVKYVSLVNSGSSANLLAFMALTSPKLGSRRIRPGDEVITVAAGFPTTVTPIIQYGAVPVFVDVELPSYNIDCSLLEKALSRKTKAVMAAHTLGNPFDLRRVKDFCDRRGLWLIEDNCDALGSKYRRLEGWKVGRLEDWKVGRLDGWKVGRLEDGDNPSSNPPTLKPSNPPILQPSNPLALNPSNLQTLQSSNPLSFQYTGTFGHIGTSSFYPPHHMTMGEGGAVYTDSPQLKRLVDSFRDWGRDCWCASGKDNTCNRRFTQKFGDLPPGYDHKYVYSHFGYNLKATEMQAAIGLAQLKKLPKFIEARKSNWLFLRKSLEAFSGKLILPEPAPDSDPSWFGFLITVKKDAGFTRDQLVAHLEKNKIQTRMLFAGNLIKHPCFDEMRKTGSGFRVVSQSSNPPTLQPSNPQTLQSSYLPVTDRIMRDTFWIGVYPGMTREMISYMAKTFGKIVSSVP